MLDAEPAAEHAPKAELSGKEDLWDYAREHLDFETIKERLAERATSGLGRVRCLNLGIEVDHQKVQRRLLETEEMRSLMGRSRVPLAGISDIRSVLQRADKGALLSAEELWAVAECVEAGCELSAYLKKHHEMAPTLVELAEQIKDSDVLAGQVKKCVNEEGNVADRASPELYSIRRQIRSRSEKLRSQLEQMTKSDRMRTYLQEPIVTQRSGRYVLPVRVQHKDRIQGIVHGQSSSGATVFIEPQVAVDLNNEIRNLRSEEEREIERILRRLSDEVARQADRLRAEQAVLAEVDLIYARGRLAEDMDAVMPNTNSDGYVYLKKARHPLLEGEVVPIDVEVGRDFHVLVITGPNTGGKTVTLKTVGLMVLMCQAGLHLPCSPSSDVGIFRRVYCDIGDEQSIAQNLSTFSSHMRNVIPILKMADSETLVLLDELGAGTDPMEGAPLAMCILEELHQRHVRTMATTHYSRLKTFAYRKDGIQNASMEFDAETLSPTYHLVMGLPGRSNALEIAQRLGMPDELVSRARSFLSDDEGNVEELISAMEQDRRKWLQYREKAGQEATDAEKLRERLARRERDLREQKEKILSDARREVRDILSEARREVSALLNELRSELNALKEFQDQLRRRLEMMAEDSGQADDIDEDQFVDTDEVLRRAEALRQVLSSIEEGARGSLSNVEGSMADVVGEAEEQTRSETKGETHEGISPEELEPGAYVRIRSLQQTGRVLEVDTESEQALIQVGVMKMRTDTADLQIAADPEEQRGRSQVGKLSRSKSEVVHKELNVRQHTVDDAIMQLQKYIDDAFLAGHDSVTIIHGRGEGILRRAVREHLENNPEVIRWRKGNISEGGDGVTIAFLR